MVTSQPILNQLKALIERYEQADSAANWSGDSRWKSRHLKGLLSSAQAAIERLSPAGSSYLVNSHEILASQYSNDAYKLECLIGIVEALRNDYESGALAPIQELIRAEVFDDFLDMAQHLLESGYKDPAAVVVGSVLEGELRKLAGRASVPTTSPGRAARKVIHSPLGK